MGREIRDGRWDGTGVRRGTGSILRASGLYFTVINSTVSGTIDCFWMRLSGSSVKIFCNDVVM